ncbi:rhomboid family intramembrane serine protease [Halobacteriales archaeon QS_4_70_19]|nr:MAG: rhomboid family intramembrane serine protease [Halobacteriales archaeon QS_4_70_19]
MATCAVCGKHVDMPYRCNRCGQNYCSEHRLPENHSCAGLNDWDDPDGVFDSGFDDSVRNRGRSGGGLSDRASGLFGTGGPLSYVRGNVSYLFLAIMFVVFVLEFLVLATLGRDAFRDVFVLTSAHPEYVWTWVTSVFSHSPKTFFHIIGNGIVLYFFGPVVERRIGSRRFAALFLATGMIAGLSQITFGLLIGDPVSGVLGASGAIMAILGILTVLNPNLKVYLYFILPVPIWVLTLGYAGLSVFGALSTTNALSNVAHVAHLSGLVLGLAYGQHVKGKVRGPSDELQLGGGMRRGGGRGPF